LGGQRGGTNIIEEKQAQPVQVGFNIVTPGYFHTIGISIMRGRDFSQSDRVGTTPVAMINEEMVRRFYSGRDPIGHSFVLQWNPATVVEVVGVVKDGKFRNYRAAFEPTVYVPLAQRYNMQMNLEVRARGNLANMLASIRREVLALDPGLPPVGAKTLKAHFDNALAQERLSAFVLTCLGVLALALAAIGIYGVLAYSVARRTKEIGIRMALGAQASTVQAEVLGGVLWIVGLGLGIGIVAALSLAKLVNSLLYGLSPADPVVFATAIAVLVLAALIAAMIPARRAARIDPWRALRYE
jgi:predicted permease